MQQNFLALVLLEKLLGSRWMKLVMEMLQELDQRLRLQLLYLPREDLWVKLIRRI